MAVLIPQNGRNVIIRNGGRGVAGAGVAAGGTTGQSLVKLSDTDYDTEWQTPPGGGDLLAANNLSDLASAGTARTNIDVDQAGTDNSDVAATILRPRARPRRSMLTLSAALTPPRPTC